MGSKYLQELNLGDSVTCACCGKDFICGWTKEEALAEEAKNGWTDISAAEKVLVCDVCYQTLMYMEYLFGQIEEGGTA